MTPGAFSWSGRRAAEPEKLAGLQDSLEQLRDTLKDQNSAFPETQKFLQERGLTHVNQLDKEGMKALQDHLEAVLDATLKKTLPGA